MSTIGNFGYVMRHQSFMQMWLIVVLLGSWVRQSLAQEALTKLLVAHAGLISTHASVWLAEDQGFYKKHGLDATSVFTGSGSVTSQALIAGEAKVASTSVGPTAAAVGGGADLMIVAGTIHIMPYQFWVLPQVRQPADLKGKRVAISTFGSGSHLAAEVALQVLGLEPSRDKIAILQVGTQAERVGRLGGRVGHFLRLRATGAGQGTHNDVRSHQARRALLEYGSRYFAALRQRESADYRILSQRNHRRLGFSAQPSQ